MLSCDGTEIFRVIPRAVKRCSGSVELMSSGGVNPTAASEFFSRDINNIHAEAVDGTIITHLNTCIFNSASVRIRSNVRKFVFGGVLFGHSVASCLIMII